jgi:hypothetical protein
VIAFCLVDREEDGDVRDKRDDACEDQTCFVGVCQREERVEDDSDHYNRLHVYLEKSELQIPILRIREVAKV